ncbi:MAG: RNA 2',3'-cyclic phosphodiesterase [Gemmatimonadota bacterium]|nr:RNA 2',3'-cyclic phosphodiesterase [Gemmatimonadota bacterium]
MFVAIPVPADRRAAIDRLAGAFRRGGVRARWVRPERLHLTLRFLGEVPEAEVAGIVRALDGAVASRPSFRLRFGRPGAFPSPRRPRVLWLGVEADAALGGLYADVERALAAVGHPGDGKAFRPHLTLGRVRPGGGPAAAEALARATCGAETVDGFEVSRVDLVCSVPGPAEYEHRTLHTAFLAND